MRDKILKSDAEWKKELTPDQYRVTREHSTERAFTGALYKTKTPGTYVCVCCGNPLFDSDTKYESGSGWPSFYAPLGDDAVETERDYSFGMAREEVHCAHCDAHLGHLFDDGPEPTGLRYCMNSASLNLIPK